MLAMRRAVIKLGKKVDLILIDGNSDPMIPSVAVKCIVKGDQKCISIAAASIVAKVTRDNIMGNLSKEFAGYGWEKNSGYGTAMHKKAINDLGITKIHRSTFLPMRKMLRTCSP